MFLISKFFKRSAKQKNDRNKIRGGTPQKDDKIKDSEEAEVTKYRDAGKLYVGGLHSDITSKSLKEYFIRFGEVVDAIVMSYPKTGKSRGFGFVTFVNPSDAEATLKVETHILEGRKIHISKFYSKDSKSARNDEACVFLGGLPYDLERENLINFFSRYGKVTTLHIPLDRNTNRPRGYGFLSFEHKNAAEKCLMDEFVYLEGRRIIIKKTKHCDSSNAKDGSNDFIEKEISTLNLCVSDGEDTACVSDYEIHSSVSGETLSSIGQNPELRQLCTHYLMPKLILGSANNQKKSKDKEWKLQEAEDRDTEMLMESLVRFSQVEERNKKLIEFSDEDILYRDTSCGPKYNPNYTNSLDELNAKASDDRSSFYKKSSSELSVCKDDKFLDIKKSLVTPQKKEPLYCTACQWASPDGTSTSFLIHCKAVTHRMKIRERFFQQHIQDEEQTTGSLGVVNSEAEITQRFKKSVSEKPNLSKATVILKSGKKNQTKPQQVKEAQTKVKKEKIGQAQQKKKIKDTHTKKKDLKLSVLAESMVAIQALSQSQLICTMCNKTFPNSQELDVLTKNVSAHIRSKGHLHKLLEAKNTLKNFNS